MPFSSCSLLHSYSFSLQDAVLFLPSRLMLVRWGKAKGFNLVSSSFQFSAIHMPASLTTEQSAAQRQQLFNHQTPSALYLISHIICKILLLNYRVVAEKCSLCYQYWIRSALPRLTACPKLHPALTLDFFTSALCRMALPPQLSCPDYSRSFPVLPPIKPPPKIQARHKWLKASGTAQLTE